MLDLLGRPECLPFSVALVVMLFIAALEGVTLVLGMGVSSALESVMPDFDYDLDADLGGDGVEGSHALSKFLGWLRVGKVPVLMLFVIFLTAFGLVGLVIQGALLNSIGTLSSAWLVAILAFLVAIPVVRLGGSVLVMIMPQDETDAVSEGAFLGRVATLVIGSATQGNPAQAKLRGPKGNTHYVMVEPDDIGARFVSGEQVLLVSQHGTVYRAIANPNPALID
jgi:hypothetical protein